jgi:Nuclease-related domain
MRLRWSEAVILTLPLLIAGLFLAGGSWVPAVIVLSFTAFAAASRAHIVERNIPGFHARRRGTLLLFQAVGLLGVYIVLVYGFWVMRQHHWSHDTHGLVAFYASAGLAIFLLRDIWRLGNRADNYLTGSDAEEAVAAQLDPLRQEGWTVVHNVLRDDGRGNVDHFASVPGGPAYAIETKSGRLYAADRGQAISNAIWAKGKFGAGYTTAILCVGKEPPAEPTLTRHGNSTVWVLGPSQLGAFLRSRRR